MSTSRKISSRFVLAPAVIAIAALNSLAGCNNIEDIKSSTPTGYGRSLENVTGPKGEVAQVIEYEAMTISYNANRHLPNWVAWELLASETYGNVPRESQFKTDTGVRGCASTNDYTRSGYDRGHMAPAADMKWSKKAMEESFFMTNVCPQVNSFNAGVWARLEEKCRTWAKADSAIIIVAGPVMTDEMPETIGNIGVRVPRRFFKVVLSPYANPPRAIGFIMNNGTVDGGMQAAAVSVDEVERVTGLDFFSALPDQIEADVESRCNFNFWSNLKPY